MLASKDAGIEQAFNAGKFLRTHLLRPTWHFVAPQDIHWLLALTGPRVHAKNGTMYRKLGLDTGIFMRSQAVIRKSLENEETLTRVELENMLHKAGIPTGGGLRMGYILMAAELEGIICSGPRLGKQFTYMLLDKYSPAGSRLSNEEALAELAIRYFTGRGPATVQDFAKWSGQTLTDARQGLEEVKGKLFRETIDGKEYWSALFEQYSEKASPLAFFLSIYDEYFSSYQDYSLVSTPGIGEKLAGMENDLTYTIVVDGQIVGTWKRLIKKDGVTLRVKLLTALRESEMSAVTHAANRYGQFLNLPLTIEIL
jgi:hypothetical protein